MTKKIIAGIVLLVIGLFVGLGIKGGEVQSVGGTIENFPVQFTNGLRVGPNGNIVGQILSGRVNCTGGTSPLATLATTTIECAVAGAKSTDISFAELASTTNAQLRILTSFASSTTGYLDVLLVNASSTATASLVGATTSLEYLILR